ncbi:MAG: type II toxin-antitoxin system VapC family toxin [Opitutales bacterium]|nr:type II toxin-antitoxin system VapC family toxin [Opitutales bacterium]
MITHVLDTCALLDLAAGRWTDRKARRELKHAEQPVVLSVTVWEIARKLRVGKLELPCRQEGVGAFVEAVCERHRIFLCPLEAEICNAAELLPPLHEDPFDRMILALAGQNAVPVFTTDRRFEAYPVRVIRQR